jgi:hypothetical protein
MMTSFIPPGALLAPGAFRFAPLTALRALYSAFDWVLGLQIFGTLLLAEIWLRWHLAPFRAENERLKREVLMEAEIRRRNDEERRR